ncbi:MAG: CopG family antitoxin [Candidatus Contendobacter sp.]
MSINKSSISNAGNYQEMGEFWDKHDLAEVWDLTEDVEFSVNITSERKYFALDIDMSNRVSKIAKMRGISLETLINLWVQEKLSQQQL